MEYYKIVRPIKNCDWHVYIIASGNLALGKHQDEWRDINYLSNLIRNIYDTRVVKGTFLKDLLIRDEYFEDIYIDGIMFNLGYDNMAGICFMPYEEDGNKYIMEIADVIEFEHAAHTASPDSSTAHGKGFSASGS